MTTEKPRLRFSLLSLFIGMAFVAFVLAAFSRGNYLFGSAVGIAYTVVASMLVALFVRALLERPVPKIRFSFLILFSILVGLAFAFPTYLNPDLQVFVNRQALDRAARNELHAVFAEDPAFSNLSFSIKHSKVVFVDVYGTVPNKADLDRLQQRVFERGFLEHCSVHWQIRVDQDSKLYVASNDNEFVAQ